MSRMDELQYRSRSERIKPEVPGIGTSASIEELVNDIYNPDFGDINESVEPEVGETEERYALDKYKKAAIIEAYGVYRKGGSVGGGNDNYDPRVGGVLVKTFDTPEEAKDYAKRMRKQLTPGEKSYYGMGYTVKPIKEGRAHLAESEHFFDDDSDAIMDFMDYMEDAFTGGFEFYVAMGDDYAHGMEISDPEIMEDPAVTEFLATHEVAAEDEPTYGENAEYPWEEDDEFDEGDFIHLDDLSENFSRNYDKEYADLIAKDWDEQEARDYVDQLKADDEEDTRDDLDESKKPFFEFGPMAGPARGAGEVTEEDLEKHNASDIEWPQEWDDRMYSGEADYDDDEDDEMFLEKHSLIKAVKFLEDGGSGTAAEILADYEERQESVWQSILNVFYKRWQADQYKGYSEMIAAALEESEYYALAILLGKYNQQVCNGGHVQYFDNGYASISGGGYASTKDNIELHQELEDLAGKLLPESDLKEVLMECLKKFEGRISEGSEECGDCNGEGGWYTEEEEEYEDEDGEMSYGTNEEWETCWSCHGDGYIDTDGLMYDITTYGKDALDDLYYTISDRVEKEYEPFFAEKVSPTPLTESKRLREDDFDNLDELESLIQDYQIDEDEEAYEKILGIIFDAAQKNARRFEYDFDDDEYSELATMVDSALNSGEDSESIVTMLDDLVEFQPMSENILSRKEKRRLNEIRMRESRVSHARDYINSTDDPSYEDYLKWLKGKGLDDQAIGKVYFNTNMKRAASGDDFTRKPKGQPRKTAVPRKEPKQVPKPKTRDYSKVDEGEVTKEMIDRFLAKYPKGQWKALQSFIFEVYGLDIETTPANVKKFAKYRDDKLMKNSVTEKPAAVRKPRKSKGARFNDRMVRGVLERLASVPGRTLTDKSQRSGWYAILGKEGEKGGLGIGYHPSTPDKPDSDYFFINSDSGSGKINSVWNHSIKRTSNPYRLGGYSFSEEEVLDHLKKWEAARTKEKEKADIEAAKPAPNMKDPTVVKETIEKILRSNGLRTKQGNMRTMGWEEDSVEVETNEKGRYRDLPTDAVIVNAIIETGDRGGRQDHGGPSGDGWMGSEEIEANFAPFRKRWQPKVERLQKDLQDAGFKDLKVGLDYGEKGHVSIQIWGSVK